MDNELHPNFAEGNVSLDKKTRELIYFQLYARKEKIKRTLISEAESKRTKFDDKVEVLRNIVDKITIIEESMKKLIG
ncbi:hypothetical protein [Bacillus wiedmannii]|uniref:hypothetical protein n=1 Tax=Bacillus wiedmannii TaxID=1890302 RepID=UPI003D192EC5